MTGKTTLMKLLDEEVRRYMEDAVTDSEFRDPWDWGLDSACYGDLDRLDDDVVFGMADSHFRNHREDDKVPSTVRTLNDLIRVWALEELGRDIANAIETRLTELEEACDDDVRELTMSNSRPTDLDAEWTLVGQDGITWFVFDDPDVDSPTEAWREITLAPGVTAWFENAMWTYDVTGLDLLSESVDADLTKSASDPTTNP